MRLAILTRIESLIGVVSHDAYRRLSGSASGVYCAVRYLSPVNVRILLRSFDIGGLSASV